MLKNITILLVVVNFLLFCNPNNKHKNIHSNLTPIPTKKCSVRSESKKIQENFEKIEFEKYDFVEKISYATKENFTKQQIYPCAECYLRKEVAQALLKANEKAKTKNLKIVIFDCYRPVSLQKKMYEIVKNPDYVAHPKKISKHNRGCAVDVSLADKNGKLLNMGTEFDDFSENSHYANTDFNSIERKNRKILRNLMIEFGFIPYDKEWWHFNFKNTNYPASDFIWSCEE